MTAGGSQQLRKYRIARRDGTTVMTACVLSGISMSEARLIEADDAANPPSEECFQLLNTAPDSAPAQENDDMARAKKAPQVEEVHAPDFALAVRIFRQDIKPAQSKVGEYAQEQSEAYKAIKKRAYIQPQAARLAFRLDDMEESKRDDFLRSFNGLLKEMNIFMPVDLADMAEGKGTAGETVVPIGNGSRPKLATIPMSDGKDDDLAGEFSGASGQGEDPRREEGDSDEPHQQAAE
jgi:hypothetical protein